MPSGFGRECEAFLCRSRSSTPLARESYVQVSRAGHPEAWDMQGAAGREGREAICFLSGVSAAPQQDYGHTRGVSGVSPSDISVGGRGEPQVVVARVTTRVPDLQPALDTGTPRDRPLSGAGWRDDRGGTEGRA